jgi:hypothetical protein
VLPSCRLFPLREGDTEDKTAFQDESGHPPSGSLEENGKRDVRIEDETVRHHRAQRQCLAVQDVQGQRLPLSDHLQVGETFVAPVRADVGIDLGRRRRWYRIVPLHRIGALVALRDRQSARVLVECEHHPNRHPRHDERTRTNRSERVRGAGPGHSDQGAVPDLDSPGPHVDRIPVPALES